MKIIFIGDIVGSGGRDVIKNLLPDLIKSENAEFVIANGENAAQGKGITPRTAKEIFEAGVNVITLGNHTFARSEVVDVLGNPAVLRPANYPATVQGKGYGVYETSSGKRIGVINLMGRVYMPVTDCPFGVAEKVVPLLLKETKIILADMHAEATSEKIAMGLYLDGKVSAVIGTHTHVPTADEQILKNGTAYITDAGMAGPKEGIIGTHADAVINRFLTGVYTPFKLAFGKNIFQGCIVDVDEETGRSRSIKRFSLSD
ncbi:MAG: TIGR00282 family metallophosphoesterase [Elusimicrobia bacterium]|nr:TIGR00282 family metallophosphoesterase [Elusimicrobiota bacterium]